VTLIRRYPLVTFFVLAYGRSLIQERPLGTEATFPQAEMLIVALHLRSVAQSALAQQPSRVR